MFERIDRFFARYSFVIILVAIFMLPILGRGARKALLSNDNDVHDWLPTTYDETQDFAWFQQHFANETFVLVSWEGCTINDDRLELLARKLVPPPGVIDENNIVLPPKPREPKWYDDIAIAQMFRRKDPAEAIPTGPLFQSVETGQRILDRLTQPPTNLSESEASERLRGLFVGPDGKQSCAVVTLTEEGKRDLRVTLAKIANVTQNELGLPPEKVRMGGPPVDNVAISVEGEKTLMRLFIPAGIVGVALAYWCLRSVRLTIMVFSTALYAGAVSLALVHYSGSSMNAILLTMPAVVYVAGISGAIHFANYYRDSVAEGGIAGAPARALLHSWLPCTLSAVTTSAGLFSLYTSELLPIRLFGVFSAFGVLATLFLLFFFLPAWMQLWPMRPHSLLDGEQPKAEDIDLPASWRRVLQGVLNRYPLVLGTLGVLMVVCGLGLTQIDTSIKLMKLFSPSAQIIHDYQWLEDNLGPLVPMEVIVTIDNEASGLTMLEKMELIGRVQKEMQQIEHMGNTMSAATFAPKNRSGFDSRTRKSVLNKKLEERRQEFLDSDFLDLDGDIELWRISARVGALNDVDYGEFKNEIRARVEPVLAAERERLVKAHAAKAAREAQKAGADEVTPEVKTAHIEMPAGGKSMGLGAVYTGLVPVVYKAQREMLNGLAWNFITDLATIAAVMTIVFMDWSAGLILLVPSIFPIMIVFGMMGWLGVVIDVGTIMTPTVALGVSVDDVVHFLIQYRRGLRSGTTKKGAVMSAYEVCARAMYQSWSVLGLGLAVFALSSFVPTQRFGAMMFLLLTAALVGNLFMLPSVLCSPLSYFFGRRLIKQARAEQQAQPPDKREPRGGDPAAVAQVRRDVSHRVGQASAGGLPALMLALRRFVGL